MKTFLLTVSLLIAITFPLIGIGLVMINKVDAAYNRGYNDAVAANKLSFTLDKQCSSWLFEENMREVKKRICK